MGLDVSTIERRVEEDMRAVDLDPHHFKDRSPFQLSEGEKRRVAIAGVLAMQPDMLVFDEPTAGLDPKSVRKFIAIVQRLRDSGKAVIIVTHNMDFVAEAADRVIALASGELVFDGAPTQFFSDTAGLLKIGLERPVISEALQSWDKTLPHFLDDVFSLQEFHKRIEKCAHSNDF